MMNNYIEPLLIEGRKNMVEYIKTLLYKEDNSVFEYVDFDEDSIFQDPLLFAYFNSSNKAGVNIKNLLFGYMNEEIQQKKEIFLTLK